MIVERLKHEETLHSFSDLMKIFVKMVVGERGVAGGVNGCAERCSRWVWGVSSNLQ